MATILIGSRQPLPVLRREIEQEFMRKRLDGTAIIFEEYPKGRQTFLDLTVLPQADSLPGTSQIMHCLSQLIGHLLTGLISRDILERFARVEYPFVNREELSMVVESSRRILQEKDGEDYFRKISETVEEFIKSHQVINLEGFLRFRLKDYIDHLHDVVEQALENFLAEKEYKEFIRLLRYFVDNQEPRVNDVHVVIYTSELFRLLDEEQKPLEPEYLQGILGDFSDGELNYEDLLLSALITLAPRHIYLHHPGNLEVTETLIQVFGDRVITCTDCELCKESFPKQISLPNQNYLK